jgi:hypothetical protein
MPRKFHYRYLFTFSLQLALLGACGIKTQPDHVQEINVETIFTAAVETVSVQMTQTALAQNTSTVPPAAAASPKLYPTPTPQATFTAIPPDIEAIWPSECNQNNLAAGVFYQGYIEQSWTYGNYRCKMPMFSPDGKYLAYVMPGLLDEQKLTFADSVWVKSIKTGENVEILNVKINQDYIPNMEWHKSGKLIFWENVWEGPGITYVYDPANDFLYQTRGDKATAQIWNEQHSAFYSARQGGYGDERCTAGLGGYDFESNTAFPNFYKLLGMQSKTDMFGFPEGIDSNLDVQAYGWSQDGKRLWVTITPLYADDESGYGYNIGPKQAGVLVFTGQGVEYTTLAEDENFNYFFKGYPEPKIVSDPYEPQQCPEKE